MTDTDPTRVFTFGPTALATPANAVTVARLLAARRPPVTRSV